MQIEPNGLVKWNDPTLKKNEDKVRDKYYKYTIERVIEIKNQNTKTMKTTNENQQPENVTNEDIRNASINETRAEANKAVEDVYMSARMSVGHGYESAIVDATGSALRSAVITREEYNRLKNTK